VKTGPCRARGKRGGGGGGGTLTPTSFNSMAAQTWTVARVRNIAKSQPRLAKRAISQRKEKSTRSKVARAKFRAQRNTIKTRMVSITSRSLRLGKKFTPRSGPREKGRTGTEKLGGTGAGRAGACRAPGKISLDSVSKLHAAKHDQSECANIRARFTNWPSPTATFGKQIDHRRCTAGENPELKGRHQTRWVDQASARCALAVTARVAKEKVGKRRKTGGGSGMSKRAVRRGPTWKDLTDFGNFREWRKI